MSDVPPRPRIRPATSDDWGRDRDDHAVRVPSAVSGSGSPSANADPASGGSPSSDFDGSTYYEYLERHTGDVPLSAGASPAPPPPPFLPDPPSRRSLGLKVSVVVASIIVVLALLAFFGVRLLAPSTGAVNANDGSEVTSSGQTPGPSPSEELVRPTGTPDEALASYTADGTKKAADLNGRWVVQVSAKKVGLTTDGRTWSAQDILNEFEANRVKYPGAILIDSGDWGSFKVGGYWVTIIDVPYDAAEGALDQCRSWGLDREHCLAKRLVEDGDWKGNTQLLDG